MWITTLHMLRHQAGRSRSVDRQTRLAKVVNLTSGIIRRFQPTPTRRVRRVEHCALRAVQAHLQQTFNNLYPIQHAVANEFYRLNAPTNSPSNGHKLAQYAVPLMFRRPQPPTHPTPRPLRPAQRAHTLLLIVKRLRFRLIFYNFTRILSLVTNFINNLSVNA